MHSIKHAQAIRCVYEPGRQDLHVIQTDEADIYHVKFQIHRLVGSDVQANAGHQQWVYGQLMVRRYTCNYKADSTVPRK